MADLQRDYSGMDDENTDFPANVTTPGIVETGWLDFGVIAQAGDVDWFKTSLAAGVHYRFQIEAGSINGLFDPQLSVYSSSNECVATATVGQGFQSKYVDLTPSASGDYYLAASGSDSLYGSYQLSILEGTTAVSLTGTSSNDSFAGSAGNHILDGGAGLDTVTYSIGRENFTITKFSTGYTIVDGTGANGTDTVTNVERIHFSDSNYALDTGVGQNAGEAYRIYKAAFNRAPDAAGIAYWIGQIDAGVSLTQVAQGFMTSTSEFSNMYGTNPTTSQFVDRLYQNVLGRAGEANGVAYWEWRLNSGAETMAQVLTGFSESAENVALVGVTIPNGFAY